MNAPKVKSNTIVTTTRVGDTLVFDVLGEGKITFDPSRAHASNRENAEFHGWKQRFVDAAAIEVTDKAGDVIPKETRNAMKFEAMRAIRDHYESGAESWTLRTAGGGVSTAITLEAIARVQRISVDAARSKIEKYATLKFEGDTRKALAHLRGDAKVAQAILDIQRERIADSGVDADALLREVE